MPQRIVREVRGIPLWLVREYLEELGGRSEEDGTVLGEGWRATLTQQDDYQIGSLRVGQIKIELEADEEVMELLLPRVEKKLVRAGG